MKPNFLLAKLDGKRHFPHMSHLRGRAPSKLIVITGNVLNAVHFQRTVIYLIFASLKRIMLTTTIRHGLQPLIV